MFGPAVLLGVEAKLRTGLSKVDEAQFVAQILAKKQVEWGDSPVTLLGPNDVTDFTRFATKKAIDLARFDRHPSEVSEGFVKAGGGVPGVADDIASRDLFFQRFEPRAGVPSSGKVVVLSPGFQETGRNFLEQIDKMNAAGHTVIAFDHQWSGHTKGGSPGGMDRLFGAARDVAQMAAYAAGVLKTDPEFANDPRAEVVLFGNSMGAAAVLAAATLNDNGKMKLDGPLQMPKGLKMVLQAPFVEVKANLTNTLLRVGGHVPGFKNAQLEGIGLPVIAVDGDASAKTKQEALLEKIVAQPGTMVSGEHDMAYLKDMISKGGLPQGQAVIVHARNDKLAGFKGSEWLDRQLGVGSELIAVDSKNHVMEQSAKDQNFALDGLERLLRGELKPTFGGTPVAPHNLGDWLTATADRVKKEVEKKLHLDSTGKIGWLSKNPPPTTDVTAKFQSLHASTRAGESPLPSNAKDFVYLMVPGLFTEHYPGYLGDNLSRLAERGLDARKVDMDTDASVAVNAKAVRKAILDASKSGKQVVLIGHSKGGVDMSAALSLYPELKQHVRAAIAMQAPIGGTPIATDIQSCKELRPIVDHLITGLFKGDPRSLADLSYSARQAFMEEHPYPTDIPTVSLATSSNAPLSLTAAAAGYVKHRYGEDCDGLVPVKDAIIPGSRLVKLDDLDHSGPAMRGPAGLCKYRPADITEALIALALEE